MFKKILIGALIAIVIGAVGMSAYNAIAGSAFQTGAQSDLALAGKSNGSGLLIANSEQVPSSVSSVQVDSQTAQGTSAQLNAQTYQSPNKGAGLQGTGAGRGNGGNGRNGNRWQGSNGNGAAGSFASPNPQNGLNEMLTFQGTVSAYAPPSFTLLTDDGVLIEAQLGNQGYVDSLGLALNEGDDVTVVGYWDTSGAFAVSQITIDISGQTFVFRDEMGRPSWSGGANR